MVDILLATYNGEAFLEEQLHSIVLQRYKDWRLLIHDDGSSDCTLEIIHQFQQQDKRIQLIEDEKKGLGCALNFLHLLSYSSAPFVMFCDQDDVWLEEKIETMLSLITTCNNEIPQAYYANAHPWNPEKNAFKGKSYLSQPRHINELLFLNAGIQGSSAIFNARARELMLTPVDFCAMHDHLLSLCATSFGEVHYTPAFLMLYRQHKENVTGETDGHFGTKIKRQLTQEKPPVVSLPHYKGVECFVNTFRSALTPTLQASFQTYLDMPSLPLTKKIRHVFKYRFSLYGSVLLLAIKIATRPYLYTNSKN